MRLFRLALRRSGLPLAYSRGFHPHIRLSFGPALPVGHGGEEEPVDLFFHEDVAPDVAERALSAELPEDVRVFSGRKVPIDAPSLDSLSWNMEYEVRFPAEVDREVLEERVREFLDSAEVWGEKRTKGKTRSVDLRRGIVDARFSAGGSLTIRAVSGARVGDVLRRLVGYGERRVPTFEARRLSMRPSFSNEEEKGIESPPCIG
jgi:radical SAM-linked protein